MDKLVILSVSIIIAAVIIAGAIWFKPSTSGSQTGTSPTPTSTTHSTTTSTTPTRVAQQNMLQVQDMVFYRAYDPDTNKMNVTLQYSVKNVGDDPIILLAVRIRDLNTEYIVNVKLNPGQVYSDSMTILKNIDYDPGWDAGTEHVVTFIYRGEGEVETRTISQKGTVQ